MSGEFLVPIPTSIEAPNALSLDIAIDKACKELGLPLLGGPSGSGWSYYSTVQRCPHLFRRTYVEDASGEHKTPAAIRELRTPAAPLQVGALYHVLQALYYAYGLGEGEAVYHERGLIRPELLDRKLTNAEARVIKFKRKRKTLKLPQDGADQLLRLLKDMAEPTEEQLKASLDAGLPTPKAPSAGLIAEAERCFDAHTEYYGNGREDLIPLAIEWLGVNEQLRYTCRYDAIFQVGQHHSIAEIPSGSVVVYERKTSAWLSEMAKEGWFLDGEILGQILNWGPSGCAELFGPLAAVVVDIVTKSKEQKLLQVVVPATLPTVAEHERWIRWSQGEIAMYTAGNVWPKRLTQCFDRWGKCGNWNACRAGDR